MIKIYPEMPDASGFSFYPPSFKKGSPEDACLRHADCKDVDIFTLQRMNEKMQKVKDSSSAYNEMAELAKLSTIRAELENRCNLIKDDKSKAKCLEIVDKAENSSYEYYKYKSELSKKIYNILDKKQDPIRMVLDAKLWEQEQSIEASKGLDPTTNFDDLMQRNSSDDAMLSPVSGNKIEITDEDFKSLLSESKQYKDGLNEEELKKYNKFLSQIKRKPDGSIDINDIKTCKSFLYFNKLVKSNGNIKKSRGFDENSEILGKYADKNRELTELYDNPSTPDSFRSAINMFSFNIHRDHSVMMTPEILEQTKDLQNEMYRNFIQKHNISKEELSIIRVIQKEGSSTAYESYEDKDSGSFWKKDVVIYSNDRRKDFNMPKSSTVMHELYHVMQAVPGGGSRNHDIMELCASLDTLVRNDELYKKAKNIPIESEVTYDNPIKFNIEKDGEVVEQKEINLGQIANKFREMMQKNNFSSYEEAVMSPEGRAFLEQNFLKINEDGYDIKSVL